MQRTIGGDRLGSGKKMKADLHGFERSTHDMSYLWRSTMSVGTLVPFMKQLALPGDTWDINLGCAINTHPTVGPLFGSAKVQLDVFVAPIRLYIAALHNNELNIGMDMSKVKLPRIFMFAPDSSATDIKDIDNSQTNPSSILAYLGIRGTGVKLDESNAIRYFNGVPFLAYWDIYKNYYANKMEENGAVIHTPAVALVTTILSIHVFDSSGTDLGVLSGWPGVSNFPMSAGAYFQVTYSGTTPLPEQQIIQTNEHGQISIKDLTGITSYGASPAKAYLNTSRWGNITVQNWGYLQGTDINTGKPAIATFPLVNIDTMRTNILQFPAATPFTIDNTGATPNPYKWALELANGKRNSLSSQEGLALKTYQSDLFNNWINNETIDGVNGIAAVTAIDVSSGELKIDSLLLARKVYDMLNRIAISGGTYQDWLEVQYDHFGYWKAHIPIYMGGLIKELIFQEVVSNSESDSQPLGTLAGRGTLSQRHKGGSMTIKIDEPSYIIGIVSITPRIDYSQGNDWDNNITTMADLHVPMMDQIGYQDLITDQMAWWDTRDDGAGNWVFKSAGKQPAWINYMTNTNKILGNFAVRDNEMFMTFNRRYETTSAHDPIIKDLTTYIDPSKFNYIFAATALDAQNYWVQISIDATARRKMSHKLIPNL